MKYLTVSIRQDLCLMKLSLSPTFCLQEFFSFISYSTKQIVLKLSLEQRLLLGQINTDEERWMEGWTGGLGPTSEDNKLCFIGSD